MRHKKPALIFLGLSAVLFVITLVMGVRALHRSPAEPQQTEQVQTVEKPGFFARLFHRGGEETATPEPSPTAEPTPTIWPGPEIPERTVPAGAEYFADAAFLGNEMLDSLMMYDSQDILPDDEGSWFWDEELTVLEAIPYAEEMKGGSFGKIYVTFGTHEMNYDSSSLREAYNMLLDRLQADHPQAIVYLVSAPPVSLWKTSNSSSTTRELVQSFNAMLKELAEERQVWFLNVYSALCNEEGYLPSDVTNDGVHFTPAHYELWYAYMQSHYIPDGTTADAPAAPPTAATGQTSSSPSGDSAG